MKKKIALFLLSMVLITSQVKGEECNTIYFRDKVGHPGWIKTCTKKITTLWLSHYTTQDVKVGIKICDLDGDCNTWITYYHTYTNLDTGEKKTDITKIKCEGNDYCYDYEFNGKSTLTDPSYPFRKH
jgi:hypothetical protein